MRTHSRAVVAAVAALLPILTVITACSSGSSSGTQPSSSATQSSSSSAQSPSAAAAAAPGGAPIVLGTIGGYTGVQSSALAMTQEVGQAWVKSVNASGGINGHPVKLISLDDGSDPATSLQDAQQLITQDHVLAIVGQTSLVDAVWASYAESKGIPVIGGTPFDTPSTSNPDYFPTGTSSPGMFLGQITQVKDAGLKNFQLLYCAESPVCKQAVSYATAAAKIVGGVSVSSAQVSSSAPSYTAQCLAAKSANVDAFMPAVDDNVVVRVVDSCVQLGYAPHLVNQTEDSGTAWLKDPNTNNTLLISPNANYVDGSLPATKQFLDALATYAPGLTTGDQFSSNVIYPWIAGELFEAAAKEANIGPASTPADLKRGLYALKDETLGGLTQPLTYTPGKPTVLTCYFVDEVRNGQFVSLDGNKPVCPSASEAAQLKSDLQLG
jgi:branched-chain amino acid transport system substrate-binding protein